MQVEQGKAAQSKVPESIIHRVLELYSSDEIQRVTEAPEKLPTQSEDTKKKIDDFRIINSDIAQLKNQLLEAERCPICTLRFPCSHQENLALQEVKNNATSKNTVRYEKQTVSSILKKLETEENLFYNEENMKQQLIKRPAIRNKLAEITKTQNNPRHLVDLKPPLLIGGKLSDRSKLKVPNSFISFSRDASFDSQGLAVSEREGMHSKKQIYKKSESEKPKSQVFDDAAPVIIQEVCMNVDSLWLKSVCELKNSLN